jgi:aspartate/glutamate racemase
VSSIEYYRILNEPVRDERGGLRSAPLLLHSFDFAGVASLQAAGAGTKPASCWPARPRGWRPPVPSCC